MILGVRACMLTIRHYVTNTTDSQNAGALGWDVMQEAAALGGQRPTSSVNVPAASSLLDHPRTVSLREADLLPHPDGWLTGLFDPANLDALIAASQDASGAAETFARVEGTLAGCHRKVPATERRWTPRQ